MLRPSICRASAWLALPLLIVGVAGCGERAPSTEGDTTAVQTATAGDLVLASAMVALPPPGTAPSDLPDPDSEGAQFLREYCTACHALPSPATHSATDWPVVLRRMWLRTEGVADRFSVPVPDARQRVVLLNYILENALVVARSDLPGGPGRDLFSNTCNRCHELPDPKQHSSNDWAAVVIRMRQHMVQMLRQSPSQSEVQDVILYLERASANR
jgi:cytochrome c5